MTENENISLKFILLCQIILTIIAYFLIQYFLSPQVKELWWLPASYFENIFWGISAALILFIPIYLYLYFRSTQFIKALEPFLFLFDQPVLILILMAILAGLGEELLFRGFMQEYLGIWWATVIFVLPHLNIPLSLPHIMDRFLLIFFYLGAGLLLGFLAREIGLVAAITAHSLYDFLVFLSIKNHQFL